MTYREEPLSGEPQDIKRSQQAGISKIFYFFEKYTTFASGRTIGRKIGVVQEILVRKHLLRSERITDALVFEPQLPGFSGASHKVEFVLCQPLKVAEFSVGGDCTIGGCNFRLVSVDPRRANTVFEVTRDAVTLPVRLSLFQVAERMRFTKNKVQGVVPFGASVKLSAIRGDSARLAVLDINDVRASVESKRVGAQRFADSEKLGSGIQTIEKAKQAALVAIDADLKFNRQLKALSEAGATRRYISFVILGNGVHWTEKDLSVLNTYVDYTFLVPDETIIRYAQYVGRLAEEQGEPFLPFFQSYFEGMTKTEPDDFEVGEDDFQLLRPTGETRSLMTILEAQIEPYPAELV